MPINKTQHFVPRCLLRPFTRDANNKAINVFNLDLAKAIPNAPVKNQCASDYFYGDDLVLERRLQTFEVRYAARLKWILSSGYALSGEDAAMLQEFWLLQYLRTDAAARTEVQMIEQMDEETGGLPPGYLITLKDAVQTAMKIFFDDPAAVADLNVRLIRNRTDRPFFSSDNPAIMTNRWHLTDPRASLLGPGLESAGSIGLMPLSPDVMCVLYDPGLYSVAHAEGWSELERANDVDALNEQQVLNCQANLYFGCWEDRAYVADLAAATGSGRLAARYDITYAVLDHEDDGVASYHEVSAEEAKGHSKSMVHIRKRLPVPSQWPSLIRWRPGGTVYDSGNGTGFLRKRTRDPSAAYNKVKVRA